MRALLLSLVLACAALSAAPPKAVPLDVSGDTVRVVRSFPVKITAAPGAGYYSWTVPPAVTYTRAHNVLTVTAAPKGSHTIGVAAVSGKVGPDKVAVEFIVEEGETTLVVGDVPGPTPPVPPDPPVPPTPEGPMRVLIVYETAERAKMPASQDAILNSVGFRAFLNGVCGDDPQTGSKKAWWMLDKDADVSGLAPHWQAAMKRHRPKVPYIHIMKGDAVVYEDSLPANVEETTALIRKYVTATKKIEKGE